MTSEIEKNPQFTPEQKEELQARLKSVADCIYDTEGGLITDEDRIAIEQRFWREVIEREAQAASE